MKAVILAGGLGTRLKPLTEVIPKPLLPIGGRSILEIQIERLREHGFNEIYLATNYKSNYIENFFGDGSRYGVKILFSKEMEPLGTAGPLLLLKKHLNEPFLVINGDILTLANFRQIYDYAIGEDSMLTLCIKQEIFPFPYGSVSFRNEYVTAMEEKPNLIMHILAGIYILKPEIFKYFPAQTYFGMDTLINLLLMDDVPVLKYDLKEYWLDISRLDDYERAQELYKHHFIQK